MEKIIFEDREKALSKGIDKEQHFQTISSDIVNIIKEVNKDQPEKRNMSTIDKLSRVESMELIGVLEIDSLIEFNALDESFGRFTTKFLRLKISEDGKGREEITDIVIGQKRQQQQKSFVERMLGGKPKDNNQAQQQNNGGV
jgi:hypothetical protein